MATLHMICGKMGAGKSTLAAALAKGDATVLLSEDAWLSTLYGDQMQSGADYVRFSAKLRAAMGPHVAALLSAGVTVVLDWPANTVETRAWMRGILDTTGAEHRLHVLTTPDEVCLARMHARNRAGAHPFAVTEAQFERFSKHFVPPTPEEGFTLVMHPPSP